MDLSKMNFTQDQANSLIELLSQVLNSSTVPQEPQTFAEKVDQKAEESIQTKVSKYKKRINKVEYINNCFRIAIQDYFDEAMVDFIIKNLDEGRKANDWGNMIRVYNKIKDNHLRQLVLAMSALYRLQFIDKATKDRKIRTRISQLRSQVKYATICDTCGMIAREVTEYLEAKF